MHQNRGNWRSRSDTGWDRTRSRRRASGLRRNWSAGLCLCLCRSNIGIVIHIGRRQWQFRRVYIIQGFVCDVWRVRLLERRCDSIGWTIGAPLCWDWSALSLRRCNPLRGSSCCQALSPELTLGGAIYREGMVSPWCWDVGNIFSFLFWYAVVRSQRGLCDRRTVWRRNLGYQLKKVIW